MTPSQRKEELSKAYIQAVAGMCGFTVGTWSQDHGCIDTTIRSPAKAAIDLQLKATSSQSIARDGFLAWQVEGAHYDKMSKVEVTTPHYLVLLWLPGDEAQWVEQSLEELILRRCAYFVKMTGQPARTAADPTVRLPLNQPFTADNLRTLMAASERGEHLAWANHQEADDEA
ncbi:MAG: DUF4365 domain-containing protein [Myxococcales bacterium]|nr:DUF4365 domain-containing protein [Myxococcales bacterium]